MLTSNSFEDSYNNLDETEEHVVLEDNRRLDSYVSEAYQVSRSKAATLIDKGYVSVNSCCEKKSFLLSKGDVIKVLFPDSISSDIVPENIPLDIVFEDQDLLIVNKSQGMVVHPAPGNMSGTLVNALMYHIKDLSGINGVLRPGIVHRIDKYTSGLLIVAKNDKAHISLAEQIKAHSFDRCYEAVVHGTPKQTEGCINYSIGRSRTDRKKMAAFDENSVLPGVRKAKTHFSIVEDFGKYSHLKLVLETGRTHQIRVHMKAIGHPVVGDNVYGSDKLKSFGLDGQCLHAKSIGFIHPTTKREMFFDSSLPNYFTIVLDKIKTEVGYEV